MCDCVLVCLFDWFIGVFDRLIARVVCLFACLSGCVVVVIVCLCA